MKINITQDVIESARKLLKQGGVMTRCCPVSVAIHQAMYADEVATGTTHTQIDGVSYTLPKRVSDWITRFDRKREASPISFNLVLKENCET